jgi:hypothetical protein
VTTQFGRVCSLEERSFGDYRTLEGSPQKNHCRKMKNDLFSLEITNFTEMLFSGVQLDVIFLFASVGAKRTPKCGFLLALELPVAT